MLMSRRAVEISDHAKRGVELAATQIVQAN